MFSRNTPKLEDLPVVKHEDMFQKKDSSAPTPAQQERGRELHEQQLRDIGYKR